MNDRRGDGSHPATEQALRAGYVVRLAGPAPETDVDNHLLKAQESIDSATDDLDKQRFNKAADSGYDAGHHAVEALMAHHGVRINKDDEALGRHGHAAAAEYLAVELRHAPHLTQEAAADIAGRYDQFRRIRNKASYGPRLLDEKTARAMYDNGRKVLRQVRILTGRDEPPG